MQQEYGGEVEEGLTEETGAFELGCGEEDFARMRKGQPRFGEQVQKAQGLNLCRGAAASGVTRGSCERV